MKYSVPTLLESLLVHKNCIKVGLNIKGDLRKLQRDYDLGLDDIIVGDNSVVDLSVMANKMLGNSCSRKRSLKCHACHYVIFQESLALGV